MALEKLTLATLGELDNGMVKAVVNRSIAQALADTEDRGQDEKARSVVITVSFKKINNDQVAADVTCQVKLPALRPPATIGNVVYQDGEPQVMFQTMCHSDPNQRTFPQLDEKEAE